MASRLFEPMKIRDLEIRNRVWVSPMCQYCSDDGSPTDWHLVHLGSRAVGGAGLVMVEATAVCPEGRISPADSGLWNQAQADAFKPITRFIRAQGAIAGVQLAHAGRKASTAEPWNGGGPLPPESPSGWQPVAPSPIPFAPGYSSPTQLARSALPTLVAQFRESAQRAGDAGFEVVEIHMAHGYLLHSFLSPLSNQRDDEYGGSLDNRMRFPLQVAAAVREVWPQERPVFVRISATDWVDGGWDLSQSLDFAKALKELGIDLVDCSSGGLVPDAQIPAGPGFQTQFAAEIRNRAQVATGAVGMILEAAQAEHILRSGQADAILLARAMLRDPYWPLHAAGQLGQDIAWPVQYQRAKL